MKKPAGWAMVLAAEEIGPDVLVRMNQEQLARQIERGAERLRNELAKEIREQDADERFHYECANVVVNAPLALIQLAMETRVDMAQRLLNLIEYEGPEMKVRSGPRVV